MNRARILEEMTRSQERIAFLNAILEQFEPKPKSDAPYGCQAYDATRLCRFDRRAIDRKGDGCQRTTDRDYLKSMLLWIEGVSHGVNK